MPNIDPVQAKFSEIAYHEQVAHMLTVPVPPWDIAADSVIPAQQQHISSEGASIVCRSLLDTAQRADILFAPTLATLTTAVRWQTDQSLPIGSPNTMTMIQDVAFLVAHHPNPSDMLQLNAQTEYAAEQRGDRAQHQNFIAAAAAMCRALSPSVANTLLSYAEASLSLTHRQVAFESVLAVVYGERYKVWKTIPTHI